MIMRIDYILKAAAKRMAGVSVECDSAFSTVCISAKGEGDVFMQGEEADTFIAECEAMGERCKCLSPDLIELALAEPYTDLWA
jgi:hypothetical protein